MTNFLKLTGSFGINLYFLNMKFGVVHIWRPIFGLVGRFASIGRPRTGVGGSVYKNRTSEIVCIGGLGWFFKHLRCLRMSIMIFPLLDQRVFLKKKIKHVWLIKVQCTQMTICKHLQKKIDVVCKEVNVIKIYISSSTFKSQWSHKSVPSEVLRLL